MRDVRKESGVVGCVSMQNKEMGFYVNSLAVQGAIEWKDFLDSAMKEMTQRSKRPPSRFIIILWHPVANPTFSEIYPACRPCQD